MTQISEALVKDHQELKHYYDEVVNSNDQDHQERYGNQFVWELARHAVGEELVVYPAMEKYMGAEGKDMAEGDRKAHHQIKELLVKFQSMKPRDDQYLPKIKEIWEPLDRHMKEEEERHVPALEEALRSKGSAGESESMAKSFSRTKAFVPTRSHPSAGEHPPFETVMGLLTAPIDHIADLFRKFPEHKAPDNPSNQSNAPDQSDK